MSNYPHPIIAREGWPFVAGAFAVALLVTVVAGWAWAFFFWLVAFFILQFFRHPPREIPSGPRAVLSPADGQVVVVERTEDPYLKREAIKINVFMDVFNVHSNRSPVDGDVSEARYDAGSFLNAALSKASLEKERNALWFKMADGTDVTCVQVAGLIARRILGYVKAGDKLARGQRYGFIRFGSRVDVYLPLSAQPKVAVGDKIYASSNVIAELA
ncbi:MAG: phosphatidylserine decarboxylase [Burkholderiales bacterium]